MPDAPLRAAPLAGWPADQPPRRLWRRWLRAAFLGETLGFLVPVLAYVAGGDSLPDGPRLVAFAVAGAGEGAVLGAAQGRVLRTALPAFRVGAWTARTALAAALAWVLGMTPSALGESWQSWPVGVRLGLAVLGGAALLLSIGVAQWTVLRSLVPGAARWIGWTALAWLAGLAVFMAVAMPLWQPGQAVWLIASIGALAGAGMALTMAAVTGWGVVRLLPATAA